MIKRLRDFINKDTVKENESKKVVVAIRYQYLITLLFGVVLVLCAGGEFALGHIVSIVFYGLSVFAGLFISYKAGTKVNLWTFILILSFWIGYSIKVFGCIGVEHFFIIILLMFFFSVHKESGSKWLFTGIFAVVYICLFVFFSKQEPEFVMSENGAYAFEVIRILIFLLSIANLSIRLSDTVGELENKLVKYNDTLKKQANTDQLTGLYNRRRAIDYLEKLAAEATTDTFSVCICDIDFFKKVNDTYGHDAGDEVLKTVARIMEDSVRRDTMVSRWGGEEFLIIFPESNGDDAYVAVERIRANIEKSETQVANEIIKVTMTFGIAEYDYSGSVDNMLKEADEKLYSGKESGRNRVVY